MSNYAELTNYGLTTYKMEFSSELLNFS